MKPRSGVDEKHGVTDIVFLAQFGEEYLGDGGLSCRKETGVQEFVRFGIDGRVQSVALISELDHRLVERDAIQIFAASGL